MNITVLSGKGGTGKTLLSTNLAVYMKANYIDADVEEPNGFIFLKLNIYKKTNVEVDVPVIVKSKCTNCFKCVDFCEFNALAKSQNGVIVFDKLCHSCGGCKIACKFNALDYDKKVIGTIEEGSLNNISCKQGVLKIGEPMAVPVIKQLLSDVGDEINIIDSSPGTSCNVVNTLNYSDFVVLVTEPTNFGLHDLDRAVKLVKDLNIPFGIVVNRVLEKNNIITKYAQKNNISILGQINYDKDIAKIYSKGDLLIKHDKYINIFEDLSNNIKEMLLCK